MLAGWFERNEAQQCRIVVGFRQLNPTYQNLVVLDSLYFLFPQEVRFLLGFCLHSVTRYFHSPSHLHHILMQKPCHYIDKVATCAYFSSQR